MAVLNLRLGRNSGSYLLILLSLQLSWTFYSANLIDYLSAHDDRVESRPKQNEKSFLHLRDDQGEAVSHNGAFESYNYYSGSDNFSSRIGNPQTGRTRQSSERAGILEEDPLAPIVDYVDNQDSDVDSVPDKGNLTDFPALQEIDAVYANFSEVDLGGPNTHSANCTGGHFLVGTGGNTDFGSTLGTISLWIKWDSLAGRFWGQNQDFEVRFSGFGNANLTLDWGSDWTFTYTHGFTATDKWYFWAVTWNEDDNSIYVYEGDETTAPSQVASNNTWTDTVSTIGVLENNIMNSKGGSYAVDGQIEDFRYWDTDRSLSTIQSDYESVLTGFEANLVHYYKFDNDLSDSAGSADLLSSGSYSFSTDIPSDLTATSDYRFDHEIQFNSAAHFLPVEELCIKTGSFGGSEELNVTVWNGVAWSPITSELEASQWNNYTVSVNTTTFTVKFGGSETSDDSVKDYWLIDAVFLQVSGLGSNETYAMDIDSDIDFFPDKGALTNFANLQDYDSSYAVLSESEVGGDDSIIENGNFSTDPATEWDWNALWNSPTLEWNSTISAFTIEVEAGDSAAEERGEIKQSFDYYGSPSGIIATLMFKYRVSNEAGTGNASNVQDYYLDVFLDAPNDFADRYENVIGGSGQYHGTWGRGNGTGWIYKEYDVSSYFTQTNGYTYTLTFVANLDPYQTTIEGIRWDLDDVKILIEAGLDQEVQWTDIPCQLPGEYLCIYAGITDAENLEVDVWNGSGWENIISDLNANSWKNVSVHKYLNSSSFTIRFVDGTQSSDTNQDSWQIDAVLLRICTEIKTKLSTPLLIYGEQTYNLSISIPEVNFTDIFTIYANYTLANGSIIPGSAGPAVTISSNLTQVFNDPMINHNYGNYSISLDTQVNATGDYSLIIAGRATYCQPQDAGPWHFKIKANPTELISTSYENESIIDSVHYHPTRNHTFYLQWNDSNHNLGVDASAVDINSSKVIQVVNETLGGHTFAFRPNIIGIDVLNAIKIKLHREGYEPLIYTITFDIQVTPTTWRSFGPENGTNIYYDTAANLWMVWEDSHHNELISGGILAHNGSTQVNNVQEANGNYSLVWHLDYLDRLPLPQIWVLNVTLSHYGYENRSLLFEISLQKSFTGVVDYTYANGSTVLVAYNDSLEFFIRWQDLINSTWLNAVHIDRGDLELVNPPSSGFHSFRFNSARDKAVGLHSYTITLNRTEIYGYLTFTYHIAFLVTENPSQISDWLNSPIKDIAVGYGGTYDFWLVWTDVNHSTAITDVESILLTGNASEKVQELTHSGGTYRFRLEADELGFFSLQIELALPGYSNATLSFNFMVMIIETEIVDSNVNNSTTVQLLYGNLYQFWILWNDTSNGFLIEDFQPEISELAFITLVEDPSNGNHTFQLNATRIGSFSAVITLAMTGYVSQTFLLHFEVDVRPTNSPEPSTPDLAFPSATTVGSILASQYSWIDNASLAIPGATVILLLNGSDMRNAYTIIGDLKGFYNITVDTGDIPWGFYNFTLWFKKYGYVNQTIGIYIDISGLAVDLELIVPETVVRGQDFVLQACLFCNQTSAIALLQENGIPIANETVKFSVTVLFDNGTKYTFLKTDETDIDGIATFTLSRGATTSIRSIQEIAAEFAGSDTYVETRKTIPSESLPSVESKPQEIPLAEQLLDFIIENLAYIFLSLLILLAFLAASSYKILSYQRIKRRDWAIIRSLQEIRLLRMIIIRHKDGVGLFSKSIFSADDELAQAIAGMSAAISSFIEGISARQIEGTGDTSSTGRTEYIRMEQKGLHMLQRNGAHTAVIIISEGPLGEFTEKNILNLQLEIEQRFEKEFARFFSNDQIPQNQLEDLVSLYLYTGLLGVIQLNEAKLRLEERLLTAEEQQIVRELRAQKESMPEEVLFIDSYIAHLEERGIPKAAATQFLLKGYQTGIFEALPSDPNT